MKVPSKVRVGPHDYEVRSDKRTVSDLEDGGKYGVTKADRLEIHLNPNAKHTVVADVLLHEILHCIWDQTGLRKDDDDALEEMVVSTLATPLLSVLRSNPQLVKFLLSETE